MLAISSIYTSGAKYRELPMILTELLTIFLAIFYLLRLRFPCGNITLNVGSYLHLHSAQWKDDNNKIC